MSLTGRGQLSKAVARRRGIHCLASVKGNHVAGRALIYQLIVHTTDQYPNVPAAKVFGTPAGGGEIKL